MTSGSESRETWRSRVKFKWVAHYFHLPHCTAVYFYCRTLCERHTSCGAVCLFAWTKSRIHWLAYSRTVTGGQNGNQPSPAPLQKHSLGGTTCQTGAVRKSGLGHMRYLATGVWAADLQHLHDLCTRPTATDGDISFRCHSGDTLLKFRSYLRRRFPTVILCCLTAGTSETYRHKNKIWTQEIAASLVPKSLGAKHVFRQFRTSLQQLQQQKHANGSVWLGKCDFILVFYSDLSIVKLWGAKHFARKYMYEKLVKCTANIIFKR